MIHLLHSPSNKISIVVLEERKKKPILLAAYYGRELALKIRIHLFDHKTHTARWHEWRGDTARLPPSTPRFPHHHHDRPDSTLSYSEFFLKKHVQKLPEAVIGLPQGWFRASVSRNYPFHAKAMVAKEIC